MKNFIAIAEIILIVTMSVSITGCAQKSNKETEPVMPSVIASVESQPTEETAKSEESAESEAEALETSEASTEETMTVDDVKKMIEPKLNDGYNLMASFTNGFTTKSDKPATEDTDFFPVDDPRFTTVAELKTEIEKYFSKQLAEELFYGMLEGGGGDAVKYKDIDGKLYCNNSFGGKGYSAGWDVNDLTILSQTADTLKVQLTLLRFDTPEGKCEISMTKENDNWVFDKTIDL